MLISAEQFTRIVFEVRERYRSSPYDLTSARTVLELIRRDYPSVTGVRRPPSVDEVERRYLMEFWSSYSVPTAPSGPTIGPLSQAEMERGVMLARRDPYREFREGLTMLRSNPVGAMCFLVGVSRGRESRDAMRIAMVAANVFDMLSSSVADPGGVAPEETTDSAPLAGEYPPPGYPDAEIRAGLRIRVRPN